MGEIRLDSYLVFQPAAEVDGLSPVARAQHFVELISPLLLQEIELTDISTSTHGDTVRILARGATLLTITPADAAFHKATVAQLSTRAMKAIESAFFAENTKRAY